jgi:hypothetical protein
MPSTRSQPQSGSTTGSEGLSAQKVNVISICNIRRDGGTQPRAQLDPETLDNYIQGLQEGTRFPPVTLFYDGENYWLADGFHRVRAHEESGQDKIMAEVKVGTRREAILYSVGANATHGLRRSNADKRRVVETLLNDPEWRQWSDREIASRCNVSHPLVGQIRQELLGNSILEAPSELIESEPESRLAQRSGNTYTVNISKNRSKSSVKARTRRQRKPQEPEITSKLAIIEPKKVIRGEIWQLGTRHRLFCGSQSSRKLQSLLPTEISLLLLFPSTPEEWLPSIPVEAKSVLAFHSEHLEDMHLETLRTILSNCISGTTDADDTVVMLNLPDPSSFILMEEMDCNCFCAEPDPIRCQEALIAWATTGQPIQKI